MARKINQITIQTLQAMKERGEKITALTAYDYGTARILDEAGIELILVGDSAANVFGGEDTTLGITLNEMLYHTRIVARAVKNALVVADMPFMSFQVSTSRTVENAGKFMKVGAQAVKLEGCKPVLKTIERLVAFGIPVMGHIGLLPQSVHKLGGYRLQGKTEKEQKQLLEEAKLLETSGCFAIVLEKIPADLARRITAEIKIPTIGIGAGPDCDGQILVIHDILGMFEDFKPKFVKRYAEVGKIIREAVIKYRDEVKTKKFPDQDHSF
ncbi:MAG: 3-methyl-2-oxobutanoate hydroxymethyltransferase [candidate division WOR-3 bacterium]